MSQLNSITLRDNLLKRVTDFAKDDHYVRDEVLSEALDKIWSGSPECGGLGSDLWVEGAFPSKPADYSMRDLVAEDLIHEELADQLDRSGVFPLEQVPYEHQYKSIEAAKEGEGTESSRPGIVVTAGTGAGKTESFLIPLLNILWNNPSTQGEGISALILYPMNALVNDQVGRLDRWLVGQERLSFFHFTSETPENHKRANDRNIPPATAARFRTRQQARGLEDINGRMIPAANGPTPDILVTNYSMLEYMLCRPQDAGFFGTNLKVVVLDEAHMYSGNLAAEITLLLRRLFIRCGCSPEEVLCIATSATIGGGTQELKPFAAKLFSKEEDLVQVIEGSQIKPPITAPPLPLPLSMTVAESMSAHPIPEEATLLAWDDGLVFHQSSEQSWEEWIIALEVIFSKEEVAANSEPFETTKTVAPLLERLVGSSGVFSALQKILWSEGSPKPIPLVDLSNCLFGGSNSESIEATRQLLQIGAIARSNPAALPLVPNRIHYLIRAPEGILLTFGSEEEAGLFSIGDGMAIFSAGSDPAVIGDSVQNPLNLFRCNETGWWGVAGRQNDGILEPVPQSIILYGHEGEENTDSENPELQVPTPIRFFSIKEVSGAPLIYFNPTTGSYAGEGQVPLWEVDRCPRSQIEFSPSSVGWFASGTRLQVSLVAETALANLPEFPDDSRNWKPAHGRRLLVFSDSRAEAARLGPRLTRQHEVQIFRSAVLEKLGKVNLSGTKEERQQVQDQLNSLRAQSEGASPAIRTAFQASIRALEEQLQQMGAGGSIGDWTDILKESPIICELFDPQEGQSHIPLPQNTPDIWEQNRRAIQNKLVPLLGREIARRPPWPNPSLETLGLVEVVYPGLSEIIAPPEILGRLAAPIADRLSIIWPDFVASLLDTIRNQGAVTLGSEEDDRDYQYGNALIGKWFSCDQPFRQSMFAFLGASFAGGQVSRRNAFTLAVLNEIGLSEEDSQEIAPEVLRAVFEALCSEAESGRLSWLNHNPNASTNANNAVPALQLKFRQLGLKRPSTLHQCQVTGQVWARSVVGLYPGAHIPSLSEISYDDLDNDPRIGRRRREMLEWKGFKMGLWAEEHSAQLSPQENARLQNLFKEGVRNILSSTTTLELGIDIGGLSAVFLGNLPPGKANYLQRAGRAGRRADGTSAVLGFSRPTAFEREVFLGFKRYIDRELRRPTIFLDRAPLVRRHANSWILGEFFRTHLAHARNTGAMDAYGRMGRFTGQVLPNVWESGQNKPGLDNPVENSVSELFIEFLETLIEDDARGYPTTLLNLWDGCANVDASEGNWVENIQRIRDEFLSALTSWKDITGELLRAWEEVPSANPGSALFGQCRGQANAIFFQLLALHRLTVIEALADARVLPRYGFPIGLSRLRVQVAQRVQRGNQNGRLVAREEDQYRLQRDSMMAMREYTPGSQLLVGGRVITSRGLLKHWTGTASQNEAWGLRGQFVKNRRGYFDYSLTEESPPPPPNGNFTRGVFLFPKHGFTTAAWDPPRFGNDFERVGELEVYTTAFSHPDQCDPPQGNFGGIEGCTARYREAGDLLLINSGENELGFAICQRCGYAESERREGANGRVDLPTRFEWHSPLTSPDQRRRCWDEDEAPVWRNHHLAARQTSNLLKLDFSNFNQEIEPDLLYTLGQAFRLSAASLLELDQREIGVLDPPPDPVSGEFQSVILYDSLAGGSGHLAELSHPNNSEFAMKWIEETVKLLTVEETWPEAIAEREAIRRLLTSGCRDERLLPGETLEFLLNGFRGNRSEQIDTGVADESQADCWSTLRLQNENPPYEFSFLVEDNEVAGLQEGFCKFTRFEQEDENALPRANQVTIVRLPDGRVVFGKWLYSPTTNLDRPHKLRLRRLRNSITLELSEYEFREVEIIAVQTP